MNFFPPEMTNVQMSTQATTAYIQKQVSKDFTDHSKLLVQINNVSKDTPDYIYFTMHGTAILTPGQGYNGIKDWSDSVDPSVYDGTNNEMFKYENNQMKMNVDIDLQNHRLKNATLPQQVNAAITKLFGSQKNGDNYLYGTVDARTFFKTSFHVIFVNGVYIKYLKIHTSKTRSGERHTILIKHTNVSGQTTVHSYTFKFPTITTHNNVKVTI